MHILSGTFSCWRAPRATLLPCSATQREQSRFSDLKSEIRSLQLRRQFPRDSNRVRFDVSERPRAVVALPHEPQPGLIDAGYVVAPDSKPTLVPLDQRT